MILDSSSILTISFGAEYESVLPHLGLQMHRYTMTAMTAMAAATQSPNFTRLRHRSTAKQIKSGFTETR